MIYVITHKSTFNKKLPNNYVTLHVGKMESENSLRDDEGENISYKNDRYCELTGLYWLWKNENDNYIGLVHYRRFFKKFCKIIDETEIEKLLKKNDIILPYKWNFKTTTRDQLISFHGNKSVFILDNLFETQFKEDLKFYKKAMNLKYIYAYNMFIMKKEIFNEYCEWLFTILFEYEKIAEITLSEKEKYRLYGFLSERLMNVFILKKNAKIHELYVDNIEKKSFKDIFIYNFLKKKYYELKRWY